MRQRFNETISVLFYFDGNEQYARPVRLLWQSDEYELGNVQFWHTTQTKESLVHHYRLSDINSTYQFELSLETENLTWRLESYQELPSQPILGGVRLQFAEGIS